MPALRSRAWLALTFVLSMMAAWVLQSCGAQHGASFDAADASGDATLTADAGDGSPPPLGGPDGSTTGDLAIDPIPPIHVALDLNANTKTQTPAQVTLNATVSGAKVAASWSIDRGEIGSIAASTGNFAATGIVAGTATVTAKYFGKQATAPLTVTIHATQNGGPSDAGAPSGDAGPGGYAGVGGEGPGSSIADPNKVTQLQSGPGAPNAAAAGMKWLYPYDATVWPRGLLAPLLQWQTDSLHGADAVYIHLKEANYEFEGYYALSGSPDARSRQPIDPAAWSAATSSNGGKSDPLTVDLTILSGGVVYGPIHESWLVAQGVLQGTVYYNSYYTGLNTESSGVNVTQGFTGAVVAIQPRSPTPTLAVTSLYGHCNVCHTVAADGKTLFTQTDENSSGDALNWGASFDLSTGAAIQKYYANTSSDGSSNSGKFAFAAPYPDGTFVMSNGGQNYHTYGGNSTLFSSGTANELLSAGWKDKVTAAVTPAFSPDGRKIAFDFWNGAGSGTVTATQGHSIAVMDFDCGAAAGQIQCGSTVPTFSGLREVFGLSTDSNSSHYAGWPSFVPDGNALVFHHTIDKASADWPLNSDAGAKAEIWYSDVPPAGGAVSKPRLLCALNGYAPACATNPVRAIADHSFNNTNYEDTQLNYEPNANPVASGGYYWVIFTSRRRYGNVASGDPYGGKEQDPPKPGGAPFTKKLWVSAIDMNAPPGADPSHPAFYLPGQELRAGNMRGFWAADPCHANGIGCETGEECCGGFCHDDGSGHLVCADKPAGCAAEFDKCTSDGDCCDTRHKCINGRCALVGPQ